MPGRPLWVHFPSVSIDPTTTQNNNSSLRHNAWQQSCPLLPPLFTPIIILIRCDLQYGCYIEETCLRLYNISGLIYEQVSSHWEDTHYTEQCICALPHWILEIFKQLSKLQNLYKGSCSQGLIEIFTCLLFKSWLKANMEWV